MTVLRRRCVNPGWHDLVREDGHRIQLHVAQPTKRFWIMWQGFVPGNAVPFAVGRSLSVEGAKRKAWKALDSHLETRRRWTEPYTDDALRQPYVHSLLDNDWPRR